MQDLGFRLSITVLVFIITSLCIVSRCTYDQPCGNLAIELNRESKIIYVDTSIFHLKYDTIKSYYKQFPYIIKLGTNHDKINVFIYFGTRQDVASFVSVYDLEEKYGPVELQFQTQPWIKFLSKGKFTSRGSKFNYINYLSNTTNYTQAQIKFQEQLYGHVIIINGVINKDDKSYLSTIESFLKSICLKDK